MKDILPRLEAAEYIWRYSWYVARYDSTTIINNDTNYDDWYLDKVNTLLEVDAETPILTPLGEYYNEF